MLCLSGGRQPTAARDAFLLYEAVQDVLGDDEQVLHRSEARVLLSRAAVDERPTSRIVFDDCGSDLS
jgi:hypothetical protein